MYKTEKTVTLLKTIAIIAGFAITLWSLGLPYLHLADAANITTVSDTLSDSAPSAPANHTIQFTTPSGVAAGQTIVIDFQGNFNPSALDFADMDFASSSDYALAGSASGLTWGVSTDATSITFTSGTAVLGPNATVTIEIGTNATFGTTGDTQIVNPASEGSKEINFQVGNGNDSGWTRVVILSGVEVSAAVDTIFTFTVAGVGANQVFSGTATTTGTTGSTSIPFGSLEAGVATTTAQDLFVSTNAANGYTVTVQLDQALQSSTGADIDGFNGDSDTPTTWVAPSPTLGQDETYGYWGFTSDDTDTTRDAGDEFAAGEYAAASTTPRVVMSHTGPANGAGSPEGEARVGYKVEISGLQEAGDDYTATLTYVATPTF
jgi:hypothetical protein